MVNFFCYDVCNDCVGGSDIMIRITQNTTLLREGWQLTDAGWEALRALLTD